MYRGDIRLGETVDIKFTSRSFTTGAPTTLAGSPVISAYVGNGTTEITAGITLTVDFDGRTGLHNIRVVATSGNGFATATNVDLVITTGTVGGVSVVGETVGSFSIEARSAVMPTTAARTLDVSAGGEAGVDWANVGSPTTSLALTGTTIAVTQKVDVDTIKTNPVVNGGTITFPTTATLASTTNITAGTVTTATNVTTVNGLAANVITAAATAADFGAELATAIWTDTTAGDFTVAASVGKSVMNGVALGTGLTINAYTGNTPQTGDSFARIGVAGAGLTNIDLPDQTMNITGNITGNLSGSVGSVTGAVGSVTGNVGGNVTGSIGSLAAQAKTDVTAAANTVAMTESYAALAAAPTPAQIWFEIRALLAEKAVAGTTLTAKKLDGATTAGTYTLNDAVTPTAITRAS